MSDRDLRPVRWMGSSLEDLRKFPSPVQHAAGYALFQAQKGEKAPSAKPLKGVVKGAGVLEVVEDHQGDTFRAAYTVKFKDAVYVLHAFQKKSKKGVKTTKRDIDLIKARYEQARQDYEGRER